MPKLIWIHFKSETLEGAVSNVAVVVVFNSNYKLPGFLQLLIYQKNWEPPKNSYQVSQVKFDLYEKTPAQVSFLLSTVEHPKIMKN